MKLSEIIAAVGEIPKTITDRDRLINYIEFQIYLLGEYDAEYWDYEASRESADMFYSDLDAKLRLLKSDLALIKRP